MTQHINIIVCVNDHYFSLGLAVLMNNYFTRRGWSVTFLPHHHYHEADMVVQDSNEVCSRQFCHNADNLRHIRVITVRHTRRVSRTRQPRCLSDYGTIHTHDAEAQIVNLLAQVIDSYQTPDTAYIECPRCELVLTPRERQVLAAFRACKPPYQVAKHLGISPQTVSSHKRASMRKLGFQSNKELYHWLQHGGLEHEMQGTRFYR